MADALWVVVMIAVCIGMLVAAKQIEPHWVSKDGTSFTCRVQTLSTDGRTAGRWSETKAHLEDDRVVLAKRGFLRTRATSDEVARRIIGRAQGTQTRFAVYLLDHDGELMAMRVPAKSTIVPRLDALAA
jgi:hypothetical protein